MAAAPNSGYVAMDRSWQDHEIFEGDEFSRRDAWAWLIANAAWAPRTIKIKGEVVQIERGELCFAQRFLADKWGWSKSKTNRFLSVLRENGMIFMRSKCGTTAGQQPDQHAGQQSDPSAGQGQAVITICNYDKYQSPQPSQRDNDSAGGGTTNGTTDFEKWDKDKPNNQLEEENPPTPQAEKPAGGRVDYAFAGRTIRLNRSDFDQWRSVYHGIPDLVAELHALDAWWQRQDDPKPKNWFYRTSQMLNRKHQEAIAAAKASGGGPTNFTDYLTQRRQEEAAWAARQAEGANQ
jgi:hypothetical protein